MNPFAAQPTPLDVRFRLFGTPVSIHPFFWLAALWLGWDLSGGVWRKVLTFIVALCVSMLVHEFGHALMARVFRTPAHILILPFGGAAMIDADRLRGWQRVCIYLAGPAAGFALYAAVKWGAEPWFHAWITQNAQALGDQTKTIIRGLFDFIMLMALFYNVVNLLPIYPLDVGQVVREILLGIFPSRGVQLSCGLSFLLAAGIAVYSLLKMQGRPLWYPPLDPTFTMVIFGIMALQNFIMMMAPPRPASGQRDEQRDDATAAV